MSFSRTLLVCSSFIFSGLALAAGKGGGIDAQLKDVDAKGLKTAQVRIESVDKKSKPLVVKPDAKGHVAVNDLAAGSYRVTAVVDGKAQSVQTVKVTANGSTSTVLTVNKVNKTVATSTTTTKSMYRPGQVGSRFGGYWHEEGQKAKPKETGAQDVDEVGGKALDDAQRQSRSGTAPSTGGR